MNMGGTASYLHTLLSNQSNPNYEQVLITGYVQGEEIEDPRTSELPIVRIEELGRKIDLRADLKARRKIKKIITEYKPDLIITHTFKAGAIVRTLSLSTPIIHTYHGHLLSDPEFSGLAIRVIVRIERLLARRTRTITTTGRAVRTGLEAAGVRHSNWKSIHPGILPPPTLNKEQAFSNLGLEQPSPQSLVIAWHARFAPVKNVQLVFDIARLLPDHQFILSGGGPLYENYYLSHPDNVKLLGWQRAEDVLGACDLLVSTSLNEGLPLSLIEASMLGKPCIATDVGSVSEIVMDGKTGFLVEARADSFVDRINYLNANRPILEELSQAAAEFSRERFQIEFFVKQYEELIDEATSTL
jgi:glycosyltransferase involved in cell wall biosynthesis